MLIAAYGCLLLQSPSLGHALWMIRGVIAIAMAALAQIAVDSEGLECVVGGTGEETIARRATINNYKFAPQRWKDHGLVYADYYSCSVGIRFVKWGWHRGLCCFHVRREGLEGLRGIEECFEGASEKIVHFPL